MMNSEVSSGIIVYYNRKDPEFLILKYGESAGEKGGHWDLCKGHVEPDEELEETALRETKEETGLDIELHDGFFEEISYNFTNKRKDLVSKKVYFFVGESKTKDIRLSHEHTGFKWLRYDDAIKQVTFDSAKKLLKKAYEFLSR